MEELDQVVSTLKVLLYIFETNAGTGVWERDEEPYHPRNGEEYRGEEEAVVVSELGDGGRGSESSSGTRDFVEDMLDEVR